jgi:hypothetical protein
MDREIAKAKRGSDPHHNDQGPQQRRFDDIEQIRQPGEAPHASVAIKKVKAKKLDDDNSRQNLPHGIFEIGWNFKIKPHLVGSEPGNRQENDINSKYDKKVAVE